MTEATSRPISRRTVAKGAAWTAPVILGGVAAPAYASSGKKPVISGGPACKLPGGSCANWRKGYLFQFTVTNLSGKLIYLYTGAGYGPTLVLNPAQVTLAYEGAVAAGVFYPKGTPVPINPGAPVTVILNGGTNSDSANLVATMTATFKWGHTKDPLLDTDHAGDPISVSYAIPGTDPCKNCALPVAPPAAKAAAVQETSSSTSTSEAKTATPSTAPVDTATTPAPTSTSAPASPAAEPTAEPTAP